MVKPQLRLVVLARHRAAMVELLELVAPRTFTRVMVALHPVWEELPLLRAALIILRPVVMGPSALFKVAKQQLAEILHFQVVLDIRLVHLGSLRFRVALYLQQQVHQRGKY